MWNVQSRLRVVALVGPNCFSYEDLSVTFSQSMPVRESFFITLLHINEILLNALAVLKEIGIGLSEPKTMYLKHLELRIVDGIKKPYRPVQRKNWKHSIIDMTRLAGLYSQGHSWDFCDIYFAELVGAGDTQHLNLSQSCPTYRDLIFCCPLTVELWIYHVLKRSLMVVLSLPKSTIFSSVILL